MFGAKGRVSSSTPNPLDLALRTATFTIAGNGFTNLGFGWPAVNFVRKGLAFAQARAPSITGTTCATPYPTDVTSIGVPRPGQSAGSVTVEVYNQSASNGFTPLGSTPLTVNFSR